MTIRERLRAEPRWIVIAAWLIAITYAMPGYLDWEGTALQLHARAGVYNDGESPLLAAYWHALEAVARGPFPMLVLQTSLFAWGLYAAIRTRFQPYAAAWLAAALVLFPPLLTPMTVITSEAQMAGFVLAGTMLALRPSRGARAAGLALLWFAVGVRLQAAIALVPIVAFVVAAWGVRTRLAIAGITAALVLALAGTTVLVNARLASHDHRWDRTSAVHDLAGTICLAPAMSDAEVRASLDGIPPLVERDLQARMCAHYDPRSWVPTSFGVGRPFDQLPDAAERTARRAAWLRVVKAHPTAFLAHRWRVMKAVLGLGDAPIAEPVVRDFGANHAQMVALHEVTTWSRFQVAASHVLRQVARTIVFRPWAYLVVGLVLLGAALRRRDLWTIAIVAGGVLYEATYFVVATSPEFKLSHWMVTCVCLAAVTTIADRFLEPRHERLGEQAAGRVADRDDLEHR